jgi:hypothetical protein
LKSENLSLILEKDPQKISPPQAGGDEGQGKIGSFVHAHPRPPPSRGREQVWEVPVFWLIFASNQQEFQDP